MSREHEKEELKRRLRELEKEETAAPYIESAPRNKGFAFPGKAMKWIVLAIAFIGLAFLISQAASLLNFIPGTQSSEQKGAFVERLKDSEELVTAEAYTKAIIDKEDYKTLLGDIKIPGTTRQILVIFPGTVRAGLDLSQISEGDIELNEEDKTATLTVPKPIVLGEPTLNMDEVQAFSHTGLIAGNIDLSEAYDLAAEAQELMLKEASTQGLLELAETNAEKTLQEMFQLTGYDVTIEFEE